MAGFALTPAAQADLSEIWDYTAKHWGEAQAERYTRDIQATCEALGSGAQVGLSAEDIRAGYRKIGVGSHVLYYREREARLKSCASCIDAWTLPGIYRATSRLSG